MLATENKEFGRTQKSPGSSHDAYENDAGRLARIECPLDNRALVPLKERTAWHIPFAAERSTGKGYVDTPKAPSTTRSGRHDIGNLCTVVIVDESDLLKKKHEAGGQYTLADSLCMLNFLRARRCCRL